MLTVLKIWDASASQNLATEIMRHKWKLHQHMIIKLKRLQLTVQPFFLKSFGLLTEHAMLIML
jgi:hypothetical protein